MRKKQNKPARAGAAGMWQDLGEAVEQAAEQAALPVPLRPFAAAGLADPKSKAHRRGGDGPERCARIAAGLADEDLQEVAFGYGQNNDWRIVTRHLIWCDMGMVSRNVFHAVLDEAARRGLLALSAPVTLLGMDGPNLPRVIHLLPVQRRREERGGADTAAHTGRGAPFYAAGGETEAAREAMFEMVHWLMWLMAAASHLTARELSWLPPHDARMAELAPRMVSSIAAQSGIAEEDVLNQWVPSADPRWAWEHPTSVFADDVPWCFGAADCHPHLLLYLMHAANRGREFRAEWGRLTQPSSSPVAAGGDEAA